MNSFSSWKLLELMIWKLLEFMTGLDFVWTALNLDKKVKIADLTLMRLTPFPAIAN